MALHWAALHWGARHWAATHWTGNAVPATGNVTPADADELRGSDSTATSLLGSGEPHELLGVGGPDPLKGFDTRPVDLLGDSRETGARGT